MTDEEFAKLYPNIKFPRTSEGRNRTYVERTDFSNLPVGFSDVPLRKDAKKETTLNNYQPTPRERLVDYLSRTFWDDDRASRDRVEFLLRPIDISPAAIPFAGYDTTRAVGEGRYKDAVLPGITSVAPFAAKPTKLIVDAMRRRGSMSRTVNDLTPNEITEGQVQSPGQATIANGQAQSLDQPPSASIVPKYRTQVPLYSAKGNGHDKTTDPYDVDFKIPAMPWERSSPWVAPHPPLPRPPRDFSLDYPKKSLFDDAGNLRKDVVDDTGNLLKDIEARKLTAKRIAGRRRINEPDQALSSDDVYSILGKDLNAVIYPVGSNELVRGGIGQVEMYKPPHVKFWNELPGDQVDTVMGHELGHILEEIGGRIRTDGLEDELNLLYSELNTGRSGPPLYLPEHRGYPDYMVPREKAAEALRAYVSDPNMMKTVAPKTAAMLRKYNSHPWFAKYLQLNGIPFGAAVGTSAAVTSQEGESQAKTLPTDNRSPGVDFDAIKSNSVRKISSALQAIKHAPLTPAPKGLALIAHLLLNRRTASKNASRR
jgi:hypothetical protein